MNSFNHFWFLQPINIEAPAIKNGDDFNYSFDGQYLIAANYKFIRL